MANNLQSAGARRSYFAGVLTLAAANTPYNICDLVNAIIQAEGGAATTQTISRSARFFFVSAYQGIDGVGANTSDVLLGEIISANSGNMVTNGRFGYVLQKTGLNMTFQSTADNTQPGFYWVQSAGTNQKITVIIDNG